MSVLLDVQGIQSPAHGERGVARYTLELALALERRYPELVSKFLLDPQLPAPGALEPLLATRKVDFTNRIDGVAARVYHVGSPFEYVQLDRVWPRRARNLRLVVTLYDLIPRLFPEIYLGDPATNAWYTARLQLVRQAERVLAISETTAHDAVEQLGISPERVVVAGAGVSERFRPPADRAATFEELRAAHPWLEQGFLLYTGGIEPRKNIDRLLEAYASLPEDLRRCHQLVIVCQVVPDDRRRLTRQLRRLGVKGRVVFPGFVRDEDLLRLYQAAELFVYPSLYEGFGLPIAEAMACGTPAISSGTSAMVELVRDEDARFDPYDTGSIRAALERALRDDALRERLRRRTLDGRHTWDAVADRAASTYRELVDRPVRSRRRRTRIAFVTPLPPQRSGIADYSYRLLRELRHHCKVDAFADAEPGTVEAPAGVEVASARSFHVAAETRGGYDAVVHAIGNSEYHAAQLQLLREQPGLVLAHDVRLTGLYAWAAGLRPEVEPRGFHGALRAMYGNRVPWWVGSVDSIHWQQAERFGIYMAREVIGLSQRFLVNSAYAAEVARLEAPEGDADKIDVLGFAYPEPEEFPPGRPGEIPVVATFGLVAPVKQIDKLIEAVSQLSRSGAPVRLAVVGPPAAPGELDRCREQAAALGIAELVDVTGELDGPEFRQAVADATVAVQLRASSNAESPASVADCLAAGTPTIVSALGAARELPDNCVVKVDSHVTPAALAREIDALLADDARREELSRNGVTYARAHSFARVAEDLWARLAAVGVPAVSA